MTTTTDMARIDAAALAQQCTGYAGEITCAEQLARVQGQIQALEWVVGVALAFFAFHSFVGFISAAEEHSRRHKHAAWTITLLWVGGCMGAQVWLEVFELRYGLGMLCLILLILVPVLLSPILYKIFRSMFRSPLPH